MTGLPTPRQAGKKRILVIEDEPDLVSMVKARLEANGYEVLAAFDGVEGLKKAQEEHPNLILLDIMLPKLDGYQVCRKLKEDSRTQQIPILLFTARKSDAEEQRGLECGAAGTIYKPYTPKELLEKIQSTLEKKSPAVEKPTLKKQILLIDDEVDICTFTKLSLERTGKYEVEVAYSGEEGLKRVKETDFDLVITDFKMPGLDGKTVLDTIKAIKPKPPLVLLFSVYYDDLLDLTEGTQHRADGIISKPINNEQLLETIHEVLTRSGGT